MLLFPAIKCSIVILFFALKSSVFFFFIDCNPNETSKWYNNNVNSLMVLITKAEDDHPTAIWNAICSGILTQVDHFLQKAFFSLIIIFPENALKMLP